MGGASIKHGQRLQLWQVEYFWNELDERHSIRLDYNTFQKNRGKEVEPPLLAIVVRLRRLVDARVRKRQARGEPATYGRRGPASERPARRFRDFRGAWDELRGGGGRARWFTRKYYVHHMRHIAFDSSKGLIFLSFPATGVSGHMTMSCPHRVVLEHGVVPAPRRNRLTLLDYVFEREFKPHISKIKPKFVLPDKLEHVLVRFHSRRVTSLEFHPTMSSVLLFDTRNDGLLYTSSSDGTISCTDLETGIPVLLVDVNLMDGMLDSRTKMKMGEPILIHKKGSKVVGLHCNPAQPDLLLSCGNDHFGHIWDARRLDSGSSLASLAHGRVVNSAYFSPHSGSEILTTSQDNRIQVWDSIFVNKLHPRDDILATGSSRSVLIWRPEGKDEDREQLPERMKEFIIYNSGKKSSKRMFEDDSDDDFSSKETNSKQKKNGGKSNAADPGKGKTVKA
ncbi:Protein damaged DNA-binding 2 [Apostasia shenzhenica]|uniref:Protein damaged DNA-binding 2 n=1 Tax=Apostasia shenzhenica TaxID=1088818 RepID=A0A2H9ZXG0_9ASPA|nr:Protein damaged DNA-binding 2 [Apostasia shenzhenica]